MKRSRFFVFGVTAFALFLAAFAPAKADAQSVKGTYWMSDNMQGYTTDGLGYRKYFVLEFTGTQVSYGAVYCAMRSRDEIRVNLHVKSWFGSTVGTADIYSTTYFTQRRNTITTILNGTETTLELSDNGLALIDKTTNEIYSKVDTPVAGKWHSITDIPAYWK